MDTAIGQVPPQTLLLDLIIKILFSFVGPYNEGRIRAT